MTRSPLAAVRSWPEDVRVRYRAAGYWTGETFAAFIEDRTARFAGNLAAVGQDATGNPQRWTYAELGERVRAAAARFAAGGITPGDRVVVALPNVTEYLEPCSGCSGWARCPSSRCPPTASSSSPSSACWPTRPPWSWRSAPTGSTTPPSTRRSRRRSPTAASRRRR